MRGALGSHAPCTPGCRYGQDFDEYGQFTPGKVGRWHWDKRDYTQHYPPRDFPEPPRAANPATKEIIRRVREAAAALPDWDQHTKPAA